MIEMQPKPEHIKKRERVSVYPLQPETAQSAARQLQKIADRMNQILDNAGKRSITDKAEYLDKMESALLSCGVKMVDENGNYREPKAVMFDVVMVLMAMGCNIWE